MSATIKIMTVMAFLTQPELLVQANDYFANVQKKETEYRPMISADDPPPIELNTAIMNEFRPQLEPLYFDESKYDSYLEQLGVTYPTLKEE